MSGTAVLHGLRQSLFTTFASTPLDAMVRALAVLNLECHSEMHAKRDRV